MNVLLITADQWRGDALGVLGHPCARTPRTWSVSAESSPMSATAWVCGWQTTT